MTQNSPHYDVILIGTGPAGIFAALEISKDPSIRTLMIDRGKDIPERLRCISEDSGSQVGVNGHQERMCGWGGAGAFSDGKLNLTPEVGGTLEKYVAPDELAGLMEYVDRLYLRHGAPAHLYGTESEKVSLLAAEAMRHQLRLIPTRIRHIGTDRCPALLAKFQESLAGKVEVLFDTEVARIATIAQQAAGVQLADGREIRATFVVAAPGRWGAAWLEGEARRLSLSVNNHPVDIGVRVEVPASYLDAITEVVYEPKLLYNSKRFDDRVRTFCVNPHGEVVQENYKGVVTVNGHSYSTRRTENTNFAILVSNLFTYPFREPVSYGEYIARLANFLGHGVIVQRLGDLLAGRRSTAERLARGHVRPTLREATPGDLSFVLPYRHLGNVLEMLEAMDGIAPGVFGRHTLLYGVEVKFYSLQLQLSSCLETNLPNLFAIGDGAGVSRGLIQASISGVLAGRAIRERLRNRDEGTLREASIADEQRICHNAASS